MILSSVLYKVPIKSIAGSVNENIVDITFDSRLVKQSIMFVAIKGTQVDGHLFIGKAIELGATVVLCEVLPSSLDSKVTYVQVDNSAYAMGICASNFYENPSKKVVLVGVTGTNGKTSIATLLFNLFRKLGYTCGLLSTVQNQIMDEVIPSTHTTPDSLKINELLNKMYEKGCTHVFMEVSSHAVEMHRVSGLHFVGGIFTNITQDHLDFHGTFDNYIKAKKGFFDMLPKDAFALTNGDDRNGKVMLQNTVASKYSYSLMNIGNFKGKVLEFGLFGIQMDINGQEVYFKLIGKFNAYNLLAVYGTAVLLNENSEEILMALSELTPPPGRFEQIVSKSEIVGIVDYAHTPDALQNVLETIQELREGNQKIITVVGCGGNRDSGKRPIMAKIACELSDVVILTSDNPRLEEPEEILIQMYAGVSITMRKKVIQILDRHEAIHRAVELAYGQDIVLVAGKGHETYQESKGIKTHFDDREELIRAFQKLGK
ncbi:MAG: UDP-N-acetylmuramoyl-L-alanyl-D-glutamate--2,6-diaminopimelate ligase [Leadbetterella sp.]